MYIAIFRVMSPFVINVPTRDLLVPYTKQSSNYDWHISITIAMFVNTKHCYRWMPHRVTLPRDRCLSYSKD